MRKFFKLKHFGTMLLLCLFFYQTKAQQKFIKTEAQLAEINKLKIKVEANPSNLKAHEEFIDAFNSDDPNIISVYQNWMKKYPKEFAVPFSIGRALVWRENPKATEFLSQASILKPNSAENWSLLASDAALKGDHISQSNASEKATKLEPKNPKYAFDYAYCFKDTDPEKYDSLSLEVARNFPNSEKAAQSLYWLAAKSNQQLQKISYYKQIQQLPNKTTSWYLDAMIEYFDLLLKTYPNQAFDFGLQMRLQDKLFPELWHERLAVAKTFLKARDLMNSNQAEQALELLNQVKLNNTMMADRHINAKEYLALFKAEAADAANNTKIAFDTLVTLYSKQPTINLQALIYKYGFKLGMDSTKIVQSIYDKRSVSAKQATSFSLINYLSDQKNSLSDYKGKVVLLTYWFPGCGPCREEFPHFEAVLKRFNKNDIAYLGLNDLPSQNDAVLPLLKKNGYSFTPLRDDKKRMKGNLSASSYPTNYLIDQKGRIVFSNFRIDADNEKTLELMIKETLAAKD
ncbi:MAG: TlpA family protein disulfide reductase [Sphingobacteriaceae bacterium]|nr:MAG: TlpA family protein disulfide reductase [Sphingobacteriaceae bacterium]